MDNISIEEQLMAEALKAKTKEEVSETQEKTEETSEGAEQAQETQETKQAEGSEQAPEQTEEDKQTEEKSEDSSLTEQQQEAEAKETEEAQETSTGDEEQAQETPFDVLEYYKEHREDIELAMRDLDAIDFSDETTVADLLVEKMQKEGYDADEAITLLEEKYPNMFSNEELDEDDEDVQKALKREFLKMKNEGRQFVDELKQRKSEINLDTPAVNPNSSKDSVIEEYKKQQQQQYAQLVEQQTAARKQLAEEIIKEHQKLTFDLGDGNVVEYELSDEDKQFIKSEIGDLANYFARNYVNEDKVDKTGLLQDLIAGRNATKLLKIAMGYGSGKGRGDVIKNDFKNNTMSQNRSNPDREITGDDKISKVTRAAKQEGLDKFFKDAW